MVLGIQGMSCLGCAWLVEQLTRRQSGVLFARAGLETQQLRLKWQPGAFDLGALATDLQKFGYRITSDVGASAGYGVSSLAVRFGLTLIFGLNGLLLTAAAAFGVGDEGLQPLYHLLVLLCLLLGQFIGGALFVRPAWGALQLRRLHSDLLPALCLFVLFAGTLLALLFAGPWLVTAALYFSLLPIMLAARWISQMLERRCMSQNGKQRSE